MIKTETKESIHTLKSNRTSYYRTSKDKHTDSANYIKQARPNSKCGNWGTSHPPRNCLSYEKTMS